ncbi:hypothetical protein BO71DRAFT_29409 [Aspergillus ellipticus CBS 707.79]|uniref:Uncharacterized protein n=1 Tax=Aspergillus ellipticus CBS 707.79 TaxID=1448320 RepID=A0A319D4M6_9EURO|nr:hypothetical protein BO71DRAFT_29409 [Aspergillus ellipticus CBS 707.79]
MDSDLIFQLTTSTIAWLYFGSSLAFWLLSIRASNSGRLSRGRLVSSQVVIGSAIFLGLLISILLAFLKAKLVRSCSWLLLQQEIGSVLLLLVMNEYLSVSTLQSCSTHVVSALLFLGTVVPLPLSMYFTEHCSALFSLFMILALASLGFVHAQIIRAWSICMKPLHMQRSVFKLFWQYPDLTSARHQRILWVASISSVALFLVLLGLTVFACIHTNLQTQIMTLQIAIISFRKALISIYIFRIPGMKMEVLLLHEDVQQ